MTLSHHTESAPTDNDRTHDADTVLGRERIRQFIERVQKLEEEKSEITSCIKDVYAEAQGAGFDPKILRRVVRLSNLSQEERDYEIGTVDLYLTHLDNAHH